MVKMAMMMMEKMEETMNMMRKCQSLESCSDTNVVHKAVERLVLRTLQQIMELIVLLTVQQVMERVVLRTVQQVMERVVLRTVHQVHGTHRLDPQVRIPNIDIIAKKGVKLSFIPKAPFTRDRDEVKPARISKFASCLHETKTKSFRFRSGHNI